MLNRECLVGNLNVKKELSLHVANGLSRVHQRFPVINIINK